MNEIQRVAAQWDTEDNFVLAVFEEGQLVGGTGFHPRGGALGEKTTEIGMWMATSASGRGLATEVLEGLVRQAFTVWEWERLEWRCEPQNHASAAVAKRAGFHLDGCLRQNTVDRLGNRCDTLVFSRLR